MGAWSHTAFGNDNALDWLAELESHEDGKALIEQTVKTILDSDYGDASDCEYAIAAASIVAAAVTEPIGRLRKDAKQWIRLVGYVPTAEVVARTALALQKILEQSDLKDLWEEASATAWRNSTARLLARLEQAADRPLPKRQPKKPGMPRLLYKLVERYTASGEVRLLPKIQTKLEQIEDLNEYNSETNFETPLTLVASNGLVDETRWLLAAGADPEVPGFIGGASLWAACVAGQVECAQALIEGGAKVLQEFMIDADTKIPLAPDEDPGQRQTEVIERCSALTGAAQKGTPAVIDLLLAHGANVAQVNLNGDTLLHTACYYGNFETARHLIGLGVDINRPKAPLDETPLHYAVAADRIDIIRLLLEAGADPNPIYKFDGQHYQWEHTPLDVLAAEEDPDTAIYELLRSHGARLCSELRATGAGH